jgi:hypothetical protein
MVTAGASVVVTRHYGFVLVGSLSILAALIAYVALGAKADGVLDSVKVFMTAHNAAIMTVLLLIIGAKLIGDAITGLY